MEAGLSIELEAALVRELAEHYEWQNAARFKKQLRRPTLALTDSTTKLGCWVPAARSILLSRPFVLARSWLEITSVLEHEMAHQFVDEVLGVRDETAHGETFRTVCSERGIDARAAGLPKTESAAATHVLDRVRKLLALAGSSNQHEAELAMKKAHELMLRHNLETLRGHTDRGYEVAHLGDPLKRGTRVEGDIIVLLAQFFFIKAIRVPVYVPREGKRGWVYELLGTGPNLEMAKHVHAFLLSTVDRLWAENRHDTRVRSGRDRIAYQSGVVLGFRDKLSLERTQLERGEALVWVGDSDLEKLYRHRHPHITTRRSTTRWSGAHRAGREAGQKVVLHKPMTAGGTVSGTKLLRHGDR
jgi:hypothetical protein